MGIKPAQGQFNVALKPKTMPEHITAIREVMEAITNAGLTLNFKKKQIWFQRN